MIGILIEERPARNFPGVGMNPTGWLEINHGA